VPLISIAIKKAKLSGMFDEVWVTASEKELEDLAKKEGVLFHKRPEELSGSCATCEEYTVDFLAAHECDWLFEVQLTSPLLSVEDTKRFVECAINSGKDTVVTAVKGVLEHLTVTDDKVEPVNFTLDKKENSQDLKSLYQITWGLTARKRDVFLKTAIEGGCGAYAGEFGIFEVPKIAGHTVKNAEDLEMARRLFPMVWG